ncbi:MAG: hypothetical protein FJX57_05200, partial [Alphaproteobacteria bacterium]|nr:hypothetical protein [Alphaproteobacteria bacterium]
MAWSAALLAECRALLTALDEGEAGYIPPLVRFTHEDKAAKGLRRFEDPNAPKQPPVHFTALEVVQQNRLVLLTGEAGSGKTTFARHLARHLAGEIAGSPACNVAALARDVPRNDAGTVASEAWTIKAPAPLLREATSLTIDALPADSPLLLIVDAVETRGPDLLAELAALAATIPTLRLLVLGDATTCRSWPIPTVFRRHAFRPLL